MLTLSEEIIVRLTITHIHFAFVCMCMLAGLRRQYEFSILVTQDLIY